MLFRSFPLLVAGVATRIGANHLVRRRLSLRIDIPQGLASTLILLAFITELILSLPLPLGLIVGFLLLDAVLVKAPADEAHFVGANEKAPVLDAMGAHIFFDDQEKHVLGAASVVPAGHVPGPHSSDEPIIPAG